MHISSVPEMLNVTRHHSRRTDGERILARSAPSRNVVECLQDRSRRRVGRRTTISAIVRGARRRRDEKLNRGVACRAASIGPASGVPIGGLSWCWDGGPASGGGLALRGLRGPSSSIGPGGCAPACEEQPNLGCRSGWPGSRRDQVGVSPSLVDRGPAVKGALHRSIARRIVCGLRPGANPGCPATIRQTFRRTRGPGQACGMPGSGLTDGWYSLGPRGRRGVEGRYEEGDRFTCGVRRPEEVGPDWSESIWIVGSRDDQGSASRTPDKTALDTWPKLGRGGAAALVARQRAGHGHADNVDAWPRGQRSWQGPVFRAARASGCRSGIRGRTGRFPVYKRGWNACARDRGRRGNRCAPCGLV